VHTLGEAKFIERMDTVQIGQWMKMGVVSRLVHLARALRLNRIAARLIVALQGWTPLIITATRQRP
jgi:hypothetical protein